MVIQREPQVLIKRRVLYIGSSVPLETQDGIEAIQQPLRDRYPSGDEAQVQGIDAYVSILSTGIQLQYIEDGNLVIFFPISSLTLCAAVRHVKNVNGGTGEIQSQFLSLSNPLTKGSNSNSPAIFSTITRRTKGRKILECHGFLCASDQDAMDLVRATSIVDRNHRGQPPAPPQFEQQSRTFDPRASFKSGAGMSYRSFNGQPQFRTNGTANTVNGAANGHVTNGVRLVPGTNNKPRDAPPEFYEPPPAQGYFYSSNKTEAKTFNIEKTGDEEPPSPPPSERAPTVMSAPPTMQTGPPPRPMYMTAPTHPQNVPPPPTQPVPVPPQEGPVPPNTVPIPPRPQAVPHPGMRRPVYMAPPMPHPYLRHRFFSPPPRGRPFPGPVMMPPPPPGMAPIPPHMMHPQPVFVRRPRKNRSLSSSSRSNSRSPSPKNEETNLKNGEIDSESSISNYRPRTPPRDYDVPRERLSRREEYERKRDKGRWRRMEYPEPQPYYVYNYPGFQPFPMRSNSVPAHLRYADDKNRKGKKGKKHKKNKKNKRASGSQYSMPSFGYPPEMPPGTYPAWDAYDNPVRKPRDFRREENQFMNEKSFSKSIKAENRQSEARDSYPTAYELNHPAPQPRPAENGEQKPEDEVDPVADFTLY